MQGKMDQNSNGGYVLSLYQSLVAVLGLQS